jgi:gamma-glutamylcyclotransferase (GGCT)/AIG2-like uncharacterized protein YtfP
MNKVAVYGSLRQGFGNNRWLADSKYLTTEVTSPDYEMYSLGGFPFIMPDGKTAITIEVYEVDEQVMNRLDQLEGYPTFYDRKQIETTQGDAWIYFMYSRYRGAELVESGDWKEFKQ